MRCIARLVLGLGLLAPATAAPRQESESFPCPEADFRITCPAGWKRVDPPRAGFHLALWRNGNSLLVWARESGLNTESFLEAVVGEIRVRMAAVEVTAKEEMKVG